MMMVIKGETNGYLERANIFSGQLKQVVEITHSLILKTQNTDPKYPIFLQIL